MSEEKRTQETAVKPNGDILWVPSGVPGEPRRMVTEELDSTLWVGLGILKALPPEMASRVMKRTGQSSNPARTFSPTTEISAIAEMDDGIKALLYGNKQKPRVDMREARSVAFRTAKESYFQLRRSSPPTSLQHAWSDLFLRTKLWKIEAENLVHLFSGEEVPANPMEAALPQ